jgi:hypothetical protein
VRLGRALALQNGQSGLVTPSLSRPAHERRLVLVEGLPNSGKTLTADWLAAQFGAGKPTVSHESDPDHPIPIGWPKNAAEVIRSCAASRYPFDMWEAFVASCDGVHVMEARFCQNAACFALLAGDDPATAASVSVRISRIVATLNPLVVYLRVSDPDAHAARVIEKFDSAARAFLIATFDQQRWLTERGLAGEAGFAAAIRSWAPLADDVMTQTANVPGVEVLVIDGPEQDWTAARAQIRRALSPTRAHP